MTESEKFYFKNVIVKIIADDGYLLLTPKIRELLCNYNHLSSLMEQARHDILEKFKRLEKC